MSSKINEGRKLNFFTVDRLGSLTEGQVCSLVKYSDVMPPALADHVEELFPDGISAHGERYFLRDEAKVTITNPMLELLFEQVRRAAFSQCPSRLQSMFAVETLAEAKRFQSDYGGAAIYKVKADVIFRGDMNLLHGGNSTLVTSWFAHQYWKGEAGPQTPFWEWLLQCPVNVYERVA